MRCATAVPPSPADRRPQGGGLRADPDRAALSAILRGDDGDGGRRAFAQLRRMRWQPAIRTLPPYHDDASYIGALQQIVEAGLAALPFAPDALVAIPRHARAHPASRRLLSLPLPQDRAAAGRGARPRAPRRLPVALRPRPMARAGHRQGAGRASGQGRRERWRWSPPASPPTAWKRSRSWRSAAAPLSWRPAARISLISPASTTARRAYDAAR